MLYLFFASTAPGFATGANLATIGLTVAGLLIAVTGSMLLLVAGTVDISIGSIYALVGVTVGQVAVWSYNTTLSVAAGLLCGGALGLVNGLLVRWLKLSPLIVTIGTMIIFGGLAFVVSSGVPVTGFPPTLVEFGRVTLAGNISIIVLIAVAVFAVGSVFLTRTRHGLRIYAIGGDERAATASGVRVGRTIVLLFAVNGSLVGLAATLATARIGSATPSMGSSFVFDVLTATILGGIAFSGGGGQPWGVLVGVMTIGILQSGLIFSGVADYWQDVATGAMLLLALVSDQVLQVVRDNGGIVESVRRSLRERRSARTLADAELELGQPIDETELAVAGRRRGELGRVVLEARGLRRHFGAVEALRGVDLAVRSGEVLCLLGDNGAGKSSVIKILSGLDRPDHGCVAIDGEEIRMDRPQDAVDAGIRTVQQDLALVPTLSVAHNFVLGTEPIRRLLKVIPVRDERAAEKAATNALASLGVRLTDLNTPIKRKSGGQRQAVAIARATASGAPVVILDEPTAALGVRQTNLVLSAVRRLADAGTAVVLVTHDIKSVFSVGDTVAVLRLGELVHSGPVAAVSEHQLIRLMAGLQLKEGN